MIAMAGLSYITFDKDAPTRQAHDAIINAEQGSCPGSMSLCQQQYCKLIHSTALLQAHPFNSNAASSLI